MAPERRSALASNGANNAKRFSDEELARLRLACGREPCAFHGASTPPEKAQTSWNRYRRSAIWRGVAAFKQEGIYSVISPWPHHMGGWVPGVGD